MVKAKIFIMETFSRITTGDHLMTNSINLFVTSIGAKVINGYNLDIFRTTGKIELKSMHVDGFNNMHSVKDLKFTRPKFNIATQEQLNNAINTTINYPEMYGELECDIQAEYISFLGKYRVKSKNEIQIKRGISFDSIVGEFGSSMIPNKHVGWFKYYMTPKAFKQYEESNTVVLNILLD